MLCVELGLEAGNLGPRPWEILSPQLFLGVLAIFSLAAASKSLPRWIFPQKLIKNLRRFIEVQMKRKWMIVLVALLAVLAFFYRQSASSTQDIVHPHKGPVLEAVYGLGTVVAEKSFQLKTAVHVSVREIYVKEGDQVAAGAKLIRFDEGGIRTAPFAGTITELRVKEGELVTPGTVSLAMANLNKIYFELALEQQAVFRVKPGQEALISFESLRGEKYKARVSFVYPKESTFIVRLEMPTVPEGVLPGMTADVAIEVGRKNEALLIPVKALSAGKILVIRNGKKEKIDVKLGVVDQEWAEVVSGNIGTEDEIVVRK